MSCTNDGQTIEYPAAGQKHQLCSPKHLARTIKNIITNSRQFYVGRIIVFKQELDFSKGSLAAAANHAKAVARHTSWSC